MVAHGVDPALLEPLFNHTIVHAVDHVTMYLLAARYLVPTAPTPCGDASFWG